MVPRAGLTRESVLDIATEVADRDGFDQVTLKTIAATVNVRPPSLYNHVDGLDDVRLGLRLRAFKLLLAEQTAAVDGRAIRDWLPCPRRRPTVSLRAGSSGAVRGDTPDDPPDDPPGPMRIPRCARVSRLILDALVKAVSPYGLSDDEAVHAVRAFRSLVVGFNSLESAGHFGIPVGIDESFSYTRVAARRRPGAVRAAAEDR